jgi:hypothetical protein
MSSPRSDLTTVKCRRSSVAISVDPRRSAALITDASTMPRGRSRYPPTSSAMRIQSAAATGSAMRLPAARSPRNRISASLPRRLATRYATSVMTMRRHDERARVCLEQFEALGVVAVVAVDVGVQRAGVDDQCDCATSPEMISSIRVSHVHGGTSGTGGIRTPGGANLGRFQGGCIRPLCHRSGPEVTGLHSGAPRRGARAAEWGALLRR